MKRKMRTRPLRRKKGKITLPTPCSQPCNAGADRDYTNPDNKAPCRLLMTSGNKHTTVATHGPSEGDLEKDKGPQRERTEVEMKTCRRKEAEKMKEEENDGLGGNGGVREQGREVKLGVSESEAFTPFPAQMALACLDLGHFFKIIFNFRSPSEVRRRGRL